MVKKRNICCGILLLLLSMQCTPEKEVDLNLPVFEETPVVECYLEPGKPYRLIAYYTSSYFDTPQIKEVRDAIIQIQVEGQTINLNYDTNPRPGETKRYNYRANDLITVPFQYNTNFALSIVLNGKTYHANSTIAPPVLMDSYLVNCNDEQRCQISIRFTDPVLETNFYRYLCIKDSIGGEVKQDFVLNDELFENGKAGFGGGFSYNEGSNAVVKLFNINKDYYDFLNSVDDAQNANGNPFVQPSKIKSNIPGIMGIFTGFVVDEKKVVVY